MKWLRDNLIILIIQFCIGLFVAYFTWSMNQRTKKIDAKADKEVVELKFKAVESEVKHLREIQELTTGNTLDDINEIKDDIKTIKEQNLEMRDLIMSKLK